MSSEVSVYNWKLIRAKLRELRKPYSRSLPDLMNRFPKRCSFLFLHALQSFPPRPHRYGFRMATRNEV